LPANLETMAHPSSSNCRPSQLAEHNANGAPRGPVLRCCNARLQALKRLSQQTQDLLRHLVGLGHHGGARLLQDLCTRQVCRFGGEVGIHNAPAG